MGRSGGRSAVGCVYLTDGEMGLMFVDEGSGGVNEEMWRWLDLGVQAE